jgi:phosphohistidine swiveling domain-containing protein
MNGEYILPLDTAESSLELLGGKGRSLARMAAARLAVPGGFHVTASAYRRFVEENDLQAPILDLAKPEITGRTLSFDAASAGILALFEESEPPAAIVSEIRQAYAGLGGDGPAVAVRSSANAEDLPDMSFAGQQDTYLNVRGENALIAAVRNCWSSLWTSRAISYRHQMGLDQNAVAMAVVVQLMVPADVSGILFTANPATGERSEMIVNASFGLGEAVVGGQVTPDSYVVDRESLTPKKTMIGTKEQMIVCDGDHGTRLENIAEGERTRSSLSDEALEELASRALDIEHLFDGVPQDIEWAISDGKIWLLQSRPITNLPPQPITVSWEPKPPIQILARRQIVENIPDPCTPLFEELYLTEGLETVAKGKKRPSLMVGGGALFVTLNGFAYQRFDFPVVVGEQKKEKPKAMSEAEMDAAELKVEREARIREQLKEDSTAEAREKTAEMEKHDLELFLTELPLTDRRAFEEWVEAADIDDVAHAVTIPKSDDLSFTAGTKVQDNENQIKEWSEKTMPDLVATTDEWRRVDPATASDKDLVKGICELAIAGGMYWASNSSHTFGVAKVTDNQLQVFLREMLPEHRFTSGHLLSGFRSKTTEANEHFHQIAKQIREDDALYELVATTAAKHVMAALEQHPEGSPVVEAVEGYLETYGHLGYSLDFSEPLPMEDPSGLMAALKTMVTSKDYDPKNQEIETKQRRESAQKEIEGLLEGLSYWQFRYRHWFTRRFYFIREEVMFYLYMAWPVLRPLALELGRRLTDIGTIAAPDDVFYLVTGELNRAIEARKVDKAQPQYAQLVAERRELREARKRLHPPGTIPFEASEHPGVKFKETQTYNDPNSSTLLGVPVSPGKVTSPASLINSPDDFDKMEPGSILVCPMTNPAWTPLFAYATGLVTDMGGILGHGSIVAREYGIPAVVGTGNITQRVDHGQEICVDGDAGIVTILPEN